jgi:hypothetical protein
MSRWARHGVLAKVFTALQEERILRIKIEFVCLDSTFVKVHPDATGARKKTEPSPSANPKEAGPPKFIGLPQMIERP